MATPDEEPAVIPLPVVKVVEAAFVYAGELQPLPYPDDD